MTDGINRAVEISNSLSNMETEKLEMGTIVLYESELGVIISSLSISSKRKKDLVKLLDAEEYEELSKQLSEIE